MKIIKRYFIICFFAVTTLSSCHVAFISAVNILEVVGDMVATSLLKRAIVYAGDAILSFFGKVVDKTADTIEITPFDKDELRGMPVKKYAYEIKGYRNGKEVTGTIHIPTELTIFQRKTVADTWELTNDSKNIVLERLKVGSCQLSLQSQGYYDGSVDGVSGPMTIRAIKKFQSDNQITPSGEINEITLKLLQEK